MIDLFARRDAPYRRSLLLLVLAMSTLLIAGCQGCRDDAEQTAEQERLEEEAREEREKPTYETEPAVVFPGQYANVLQKNRTKRGALGDGGFSRCCQQIRPAGRIGGDQLHQRRAWKTGGD